MKKVVLSILVALCLLIMPNAKAADIELPTLTDHEKVTVYLFRSSGCSHCQDFIEYFAPASAPNTGRKLCTIIWIKSKTTRNLC